MPPTKLAHLVFQTNRHEGYARLVLLGARWAAWSTNTKHLSS